MRSDETIGRPSDLQAANAWLPWTASAMAAVLWHGLIDQHIGLLGSTSATMSPHQAAAALTFAAVLAWWTWVAARAAMGEPEAVRATLWLVVVFAALYHGLVALAAAAPPSDAFPYQDLSHAAALILGVVAARKLWEVGGWGAPGLLSWVTVALLVVNAAVRGGLMAINVAGP